MCVCVCVRVCYISSTLENARLYQFLWATDKRKDLLIKRASDFLEEKTSLKGAITSSSTGSSVSHHILFSYL